VLVARDLARLEATAAEIAGRHPVRVSVLAADLATEAGVATVAGRVADPAAPVDLLVNNAGIGSRRSFLRSTAEDQERLLRLNVHAVMRLTLAALPGMVARRRGAVINISSVAAFGAATPGSTYSATKAWVNNFSESVAVSVRRYGVRVLALCPGLVRTEFHARAGTDLSRLPGWLWLDADDVAAAGMRALARGRVVTVTDWKYRIAVAAMRAAPRRLVAAAGRGTFRRDRPR
jgi:short-subunit dehydrogenase